MLLRNRTGVAQKLSRRKRGVGLTLALLSFLAVLVGCRRPLLLSRAYQYVSLTWQGKQA